jgi:hypothetical protein
VFTFFLSFSRRRGWTSVRLNARRRRARRWSRGAGRSSSPHPSLWTCSLHSRRPQVGTRPLVHITKLLSLIMCFRIIRGWYHCIRVAYPHHFKADPDPAFRFNADTDPAFPFNTDPDPAFLLIIKVMQICDHLYADLPRLHFEPTGLHCGRPWPPTTPF